MSTLQPGCVGEVTLSGVEETTQPKIFVTDTGPLTNKYDTNMKNVVIQCSRYTCDVSELMNHSCIRS